MPRHHGRYVRDVCTNMGSWSFIRSAIDAAHGLGLELTCEEVQDDASTYVLRRLGCDLVQGHFITRQVAASLPLLSRSELDSPAI